MSQRELLLAMAGKKAKAKARAGRIRNPDRTTPPPPEEDKDPLGKVVFASRQAAAYAKKHGMNWRNFAASSREPSSDLGYTKADVIKIRKDQPRDHSEEE